MCLESAMETPDKSNDYSWGLREGFTSVMCEE